MRFKEWQKESQLFVCKKKQEHASRVHLVLHSIVAMLPRPVVFFQ